MRNATRLQRHADSDHRQMCPGNTSSWMWQLTSYSRRGRHGDAVHLFFTGLRIQAGIHGRVDPWPGAVPTALRACAHLADVAAGRLIHALVLTRPALASDAVAATALLDMYSKCGLVASARKVFDEMPPRRDLVVWNALLACYARHGLPEHALALAVKMRGLGLCPDLVSWNIVVSGFALAGDDLMAGGMVGAMQEDGFQPDVVTWTSRVSGSVLNFQYGRARELFRAMMAADAHVHPSSATISTILPAFANVADMKHGKEVHGYSVVAGVEQELTVSSALVDMYAKCGLVLDARRLFEKMPQRSTVTWNSMIFGLANSGHCQEAIGLFDRMPRNGAKPDHLTFTAVLTACSYGGMVELGKGLYRAMQEEYGVRPRLEHYACMVHLLGRAGRLDEAYDFIEAMPLDPDRFVWGALLGACRSHGNVELAELAASRLLAVEPDNAASYLLLSSALANAGKQDDAFMIKKLVKRRRLKKLDSCSWVETSL
ncbi:pentatricopeptide repeat-containing protein At5g59600-like [Oryza brachyantha]|uniref:pentatricopeptide repeat-containing protein At5g59600-like n=1 Tax=Oryza brachyantha TaxID=4533 RepID=UPI001AD9DDD3|nr:pentatricopeptide repeat-containing protein At5g59600-like [Oryza brachyantha]